MSEFTNRSGVKAEECLYVTEKEYKILVAATSFLNCLEEAGVKDWDGWDVAIESYAELVKPKKEVKDDGNAK